ncbi:MAG: hypothetical protein LBV06_08950 [Propionibacteriaceae bacterium]|jgi:outer membrane protein OmpA-like peptidoglycan-associated protein|nr:hypothetical protein [Propionibacteriaceae bacterium]
MNTTDLALHDRASPTPKPVSRAPGRRLLLTGLAVAVGCVGLTGCGPDLQKASSPERAEQSGAETGVVAGDGRTSVTAKHVNCAPPEDLEMSAEDYRDALTAVDEQLGAYSWSGQAPSICQFDAIMIVAEATANVPAPKLTAGVRQIVSNGISLRLPIGVVKADGHPSAVPVPQKQVRGEGKGRQRRVLANMDRLDTALAGIRPDSDEMAVFEAVFVAVDQAASFGKTHPLIIPLGSSLDSTRAVGFVDGALGAEAQEIAAALKQDNPARKLSGAAILFAGGVGYGAGPQPPLNDRQRLILAAALVTMASELGASAAVDPGPVRGDPIPTTHTVTPVEFSTPDERRWDQPTPPVACEPTVHVYDATSDLRFLPESDQWYDATAAQTALKPIAGWLAADPKRHIDIEGRTMNHKSIEDQRRTGMDRAVAAGKELIHLGASAEQLSYDGVGSQFPGYSLPDFLPSGAEVPQAAAHNRNIQLTAYDNC